MIRKGRSGSSKQRPTGQLLPSNAIQLLLVPVEEEDRWAGRLRNEGEEGRALSREEEEEREGSWAWRRWCAAEK